MSILGRIGQDLTHPFGLGNQPQQPVRTPAPQAPVAQRPVIRTPATISPQAQQAITHAKYGVLANNPGLQQQFIQGQNVPKFNALKALPGAAGNAVVSTSKSLGNSLVNTAQVPYSAARVVAANATGNKPALANAHKALTSDTQNNLAWNDAYRQTANELAGAAYGRTYVNRTNQANDRAGATISQAYGDTPRAKLYGSLVAEAGKNQDLNRYLNDVGLTQNTSKLATGIRLGAPIVSAGAQTALQATGIGAGAKAVAAASANEAAKLTAAQLAKQAQTSLLKTVAGYSAGNAAIGALAPAAAGSTNIGDYAKGIGMGAASGVALPVLGAAGGKLAQTKLGTELTDTLAASTAGLKKLPGQAFNGVVGAVKGVPKVPDTIAHNQLIKTDPYYRTYSDQGQQLQAAFDRNAANGMADANPTQIQLSKQIGDLNAKTADMRQAMLENAKTSAQRILPGKSVPLNQGGYVRNPLAGKPSNDIQEVIDAANHATKQGDIATARDLAGTLPKEHSAPLLKSIDKAQADFERGIQNDVYGNVDNSLAEGTADEVLSKVADKLAKHFNAPKSLYKLTGNKRTYNTESGSLTVGGDAKAALDRIVFTTDQTGFTKNMGVLADKFGGTFKEIHNMLTKGEADDADFALFQENLAKQLSARKNYTRGNSPASEGSTVQGKLPQAKAPSSKPTSANAPVKQPGKSLPKAPAVATRVPKKIVSSGDSITPLTHDPSKVTFKGLQPSKEFPNSYHPTKLGDVLDHPELFKKHPELKDYTVKYAPVEDFKNGNIHATHNPNTKTITLERDLPQADRLPILMHEVQHAIQKIEGRLPKGSSSSEALGRHEYHNNPIEVEARKVGDMYKQSTAPAVSAPKPKALLPSAAKPAQQPASKLPGAGLQKESLGKNTPLTADSYANVFGTSKEAAAKELASTTKQPTNTMPKLKPAPATAAENTAKNPVKIDIPKVEAGNYEQARINPQLASHPVQYATGQLLDATKKLGLSTSDFGKMVEGTIKPGNAREAAAIQAYRDLADRVHATSQSLGGNTAYVKNYFRHEWDLSDPAKAAEFEKYAEKLRTKSKSDNPFAFEGVDHQPRVFKTIAQGEALGFKLKNQNLAEEIRHYGEGSAHALRQQALSKALTEADMNAETKPHTFDLGGGKNVLLSDKGMHEAKGYAKNMPSASPLVKGYRKGNRGFKQMLLSVSQFHPVNISVLRAAPTLAMRGHPVRGAKGILDTFVAQADKGYSTKIQTAALRDGTVENSARIGTPIKFGSDYKTEGQIGFGKGGLGEKAIFERAMPAMHIQMVKSAVADLEKRGLSLDSKEAHALGTRINEIMGFVNTEARNLDRGTQRRLGDIFLAPQFTRSKWATNKAAMSQGGLAGSYARRAVVANAAAAAVVAMGVGYALHQKSDNINDMLLRAVFHPSVPTPLKDKKGNTMELGLPATQSSEVLGLLGFSLKRGSDNHLHVDWKGGNIPGNVTNYGRSRLAILPAAGLKAATNTDYAGKPLYDPNANTKTKIEQGATTLGAGLLPIGGQGIVQTNEVKKHLPSGVQQVLNANTPGSNPLAKSIGSSFGLTPKTDKTVGKGQQTTQYFDALNGASKGLNSQEKAALTMVTGSKKNPVTGAYDVAPTNDDSRAKATALLQNPKVIDNLMTMNQTLAKQGQSVDPLWTASKDQITKYYQYQAMPPGSADKADWMNKNKSWYQPVASARNTFFSSLPPGDPNRPKAAIQYPTATPDVQSAMDEYNKLTDSAAKSTFIKSHPEVVDQWDKQATYTNALREAQGYTALKTAPKATPQLQSFMDTYNAADKASRKGIRNSNPQAYQNMIAYYDSVDMNNINKQGAINQLQGEPDQTTKQNKAIQGLAKDIYQAPDGTYQIVPAGWMQGLSNGSGGFSKFPKKPSSGRKVSYAGLKVGGSSSKLAKGMSRGTGKIKLLTYKDPTAVKIRKPKGAILA